jgi:GR25 family glycosyltransferase involved in LPS biosynthesis
VKAWEALLESDHDYALIIEDDARTDSLEPLLSAKVPSDADIVFVSERAFPRPYNYDSSIVRFVSTSEMLSHKVKLSTPKAPPGLEGYLLSRSGAEKLLAAIVADRLGGHVDWRVLRYTLKPEDAKSIVKSSWLESRPVISPLYDTTHLQWNIVKGYCMIPPVIMINKMPSRRVAEDDATKTNPHL